MLEGARLVSVAGTPFGLAVGPEDNYERIQLALRDLRGESKKLFPRNYLIYTKEWELKMLSNADRYLKFGLLGDLTIGCGDWTNPASVPIRITENGWPTGKNPIINIERSYEHQAKVLETVIQTIYDLRQELNISHFELFGLRDADSSKDDLFHQHGIMRDDYTPKPAYYTFKKLIQELGI